MSEERWLFFSLDLFLYLNCCRLDAVFSSCVDPPLWLKGNEKYLHQSDTTESEPVALAPPTPWEDQPMPIDVKGVTNTDSCLEASDHYQMECNTFSWLTTSDVVEEGTVDTELTGGG